MKTYSLGVNHNQEGFDGCPETATVEITKELALEIIKLSTLVKNNGLLFVEKLCGIVRYSIDGADVNLDDNLESTEGDAVRVYADHFCFVAYVEDVLIETDDIGIDTLNEEFNLENKDLVKVTGKPRVLVTVSGGLADYVADEGVEVFVFDRDNYEQSEEQAPAPYNFKDFAELNNIPVALDYQSTWDFLQPAILKKMDTLHSILKEKIQGTNLTVYPAENFKDDQKDESSVRFEIKSGWFSVLSINFALIRGVNGYGIQAELNSLIGDMGGYKPGNYSEEAFTNDLDNLVDKVEDMDPDLLANNIINNVFTNKLLVEALNKIGIQI